MEQVKLWGYISSLKAEPPLVIFSAFYPFKDPLDPEAPGQPEDMWISHQLCGSNTLECSRQFIQSWDDKRSIAAFLLNEIKMLRYIARGFCMGFQELTFQQKMYCFGLSGKGRPYAKVKRFDSLEECFGHVHFFHI